MAAVPFFVLNNKQNRIYKTRKLLENLSQTEIRQHIGLPWWDGWIFMDGPRVGILKNNKFHFMI